jgi:hypothetical protein
MCPHQRLLRESVAALAETSDEVVDFLIASIRGLSVDDDEDAVSLIEATVGCELSPAEVEAVRLATNVLVASSTDHTRSVAPSVQPLRSTTNAAPAVYTVKATTSSAAPRAPLRPAQQRAEPQHAARSPVVVADDGIVSFLRDACPHIPDSVIVHILRARCRGDQDEAVDALLTLSEEEVQSITAELLRQQKQVLVAEEEAVRREREKRRAAIGRYDEILVSAKLAPPRLPYDGAAAGKELRFRDGQVASLGKGQKFIVESTKPEWDGGSRGTVNTKGKRGKGTA